MCCSAVSVIIPTFNRQATIARAINSVLNQTIPAQQIIVVDDGSTDRTAEMIAHRYPSITLIQQAHTGVSAARNAGIAISTNDWVAFLDSDDQWLPEKLSRQLAHLSKKPAYRVCHTDEIWIRHGLRVNQTNKHRKSGGRIFGRCLESCCISPSSSIIHRSVFDEIGLFDEALPACEDYDLWLRISAREPVLYINEHLVQKYGGHADQLSQKYWGMDRFRLYAIEKILADKRLHPKDALLAWRMLKTKANILMMGAQKRSKLEQAQAYWQKYTQACKQIEHAMDKTTDDT